ncbi:hypothetical protein HN011_009818 [Eciton burchellii]|nr:hypothetical protein HN011_009818 [Eciton burchellii]
MVALIAAMHLMHLYCDTRVAFQARRRFNIVHRIRERSDLRDGTALALAEAAKLCEATLTPTTDSTLTLMIRPPASPSRDRFCDQIDDRSRDFLVLSTMLRTRRVQLLARQDECGSRDESAI